MREIAALPWNGYKVASTFSGCGGSCLGYRMAGYRVVYANEFIPEAQRTYKENHPNSYLDGSDIRSLTPEMLLERAGVQRGELDLFDGSPPCSAFSSAGKREEGWGKVKAYSDGAQRVDDLFYEYARILEGVQPKVFVAENVSGLVKGTAKGYFKRIDPVHPKPFPYAYNVGDCLTPPPSDTTAKELNRESETYRFWSQSKPGETLGDACKRITGKNSFLTHCKQSPNRPANTITQGTQQLYHWEEPRTLTLGELRRVGAFPDDFALTGSFQQQWERIGRAVPPLMMAQVAKTIEQEILSKT